MFTKKELFNRKEGLIFNTTAEFEVVKSIKEKVCSLSNTSHRSACSYFDFRSNHLTDSPDRLIDELSATGGDIEKVQYTLPDGSTVDIGAGPRMRAPEILFRPDMIGCEYEGVHEVLCYSIQKSDLDLRKVFYQNIVLSGGSTLFKGMCTYTFSHSCSHALNSFARIW